MIYCTCGGRLVRVHRSLREKLFYMAVYACRQCGARAARPRRFMFYFADTTRCPLCGTHKLRRLVERDGIDRMHRNLFTLARGLFHTRLYHCRYCRIQFYDLVRDAPAADGATGSA